MTEDASYDSPDGGGVPPWHPDALLGPGPSALVAFTLAVLALIGNNLMTFGVQALFGEFFRSQGQTEFLVVFALGSLAPAGASLYLARRALAGDAVAHWEAGLARAAAVLAVVGIFFGLLTVLGAVIHTP